MASQQEIAERQDEVMSLLLQGRSTTTIIRAISHEYGVTKPTIERDVSTCYKQIRKRYERDLDERLSEHIAKYEHIYEKALELADFRSSIAALQAIEKLLIRAEQPLIAIQKNVLNIFDDMDVNEIIQALKHLEDGEEGEGLQI